MIIHDVFKGNNKSSDQRWDDLRQEVLFVSTCAYPQYWSSMSLARRAPRNIMRLMKHTFFVHRKNRQKSVSSDMRHSNSIIDSETIRDRHGQLTHSSH